MENLAYRPNPSLHLKDPISSDLGIKIVREGLNMMNELGFDDFTFRKLALELQTTESSIYRYFENKHRLLLYLISCYWLFLAEHLEELIKRENSGVNLLNRSIDVLCEGVEGRDNMHFLPLEPLRRLVFEDSARTWMVRSVDEDNKLGAHKPYKRVVALFVEIFMKINPQFVYPNALASTLIEGLHQQYYFSAHLPGLTNFNGKTEQIADFYKILTIRTLQDHDS